MGLTNESKGMLVWSLCTPNLFLDLLYQFMFVLIFSFRLVSPYISSLRVSILVTILFSHNWPLVIVCLLTYSLPAICYFTKIIDDNEHTPFKTFISLLSQQHINNSHRILQIAHYNNLNCINRLNCPSFRVLDALNHIYHNWASPQTSEGVDSRFWRSDRQFTGRTNRFTWTRS